MQSFRSTDRNHPEAHAIRPAHPDTFLPAIGRLPLIGGLILLASFGGAIALASMLKYRVTVKAPASIRPVGELRIVQAATEGMVKRITVTENQSLQQGDAIALIDDSRLQTQKSQLMGNIQQSGQQLQQLLSQLTALDQQVAAEAEQANRTIAAANAELNLTQRSYQDKQITSAAEVREAEAAVDLAQEEVNRYRQLSGTGAISQIQVNEKEATLKTAQARLDRVKAALNPSAAQVNMAQEKSAQEQARGRATLATLNKERQQVLQKQAELRSHLNRDRQALQQVENDLKNTVIRAPVSGVVQELTLRNPAQVVRVGDKIAQIASGTAPLRIKALVSAQDIGKVKVGQLALMRVSACPYPDYGTLPGQVSAIAPDAMPLSNNNADFALDTPRSMAGVVYAITVQPQTLSLQANGTECRIQSGMEGSLEIVSREETVLQFFLRRARLLVDW